MWNQFLRRASQTLIKITAGTDRFSSSSVRFLRRKILGGFFDLASVDDIRGDNFVFSVWKHWTFISGNQRLRFFSRGQSAKWFLFTNKNFRPSTLKTAHESVVALFFPWFFITKFSVIGVHPTALATWAIHFNILLHKHVSTLSW